MRDLQYECEVKYELVQQGARSRVSRRGLVGLEALLCSTSTLRVRRGARVR